MNVQALLPARWLHEELTGYGIILTAVDESGQQQGSVTVNEVARNFKLGIGPVRTNGDYAGRGWKIKLYQDAVQALQKAVQRHSPGHP